MMMVIMTTSTSLILIEKERRWKGTWQDEKDLPDGTYYYHLVLNDTADREFSGFLTIFR